MSKINLLPWRQELKKIRNRRFFALTGFSVVLGIILTIGAYFYANYRIEVENNNIAYLQSELKVMSAKVKEIQGLQEDKKELLSRMKIIQALQNDRVLVPKFIDLLPRLIPEGVNLNSITRKENIVVIDGNARTSTGVTAFLRNLENENIHHIITDPKLTEVSIGKEEGTLNFQLTFNLGKKKE